MSTIEKNFKVSYVTDASDHYLRNDLTKIGNTIKVSTKKYTKEMIRKYQEKYQQLQKQNTRNGSGNISNT